jgi:hypothetical protein
MLKIIVPGTEMFDDKTQEFTTVDDITLELEHSLVSLSKWESIHEIPFLGRDKKSTEHVVDYIRCMSLVDNIPEEVYTNLSEQNFTEINEYIDAKMTATWFNEAPGAPKSREVITAELVYYWMTVFDIPFECQYWHLNRLFTLIRVCNVKSAKPTKMSRSELAARNRELNEQRKAQLGTRG